MKVLIAPTDFSDSSLRAIKYALYQFDEEPIRLHLLHVYTPLPISGRFFASSDAGEYGGLASQDSANKQMELFQSRLLEQTYPSLSIYPHVTFSLLNHALEDLITEYDPDLIITSTQKSDDLQVLFNGSSTSKVLHSLNGIPLLVVPNTTDLKPLKRIGLAINPTETLQNQILKTMDSIIESLHLDKIFIKVLDDPIFKKAEKNLEKVENDELLEKSKTISETIERYCRTHEVSILGLLFHSRSWLYYLVHEPVIKKLLFSQSIPLLIFPQKEV